MANTNRDILMTLDVKTSKVSGGGFSFFVTDQNTSNFFVRLVMSMSTNAIISQYVSLEQASNYQIKLYIIKPNNSLIAINGTLMDERNALFQFNLPNDYKDQVGTYTCEFHISSTLTDGTEDVITTDSFTYTVKPSILNDIDQEIVDVEGQPVVLAYNSEGELVVNIDGETKTYSDADSIIDEVANKVPYVKVAQEPTFIDSVDKMTDTSKAYVLTTDGMFYTYTTKTIVTEGIKTPNFTNLVQQEGAWVKRNSRWSYSSSEWKTSTTDDCVIIPVTQTSSSTIRIRGANQGSYIQSTYFGETNQIFNVTGTDSTVTTQANGDIVIVTNAPVTGYMTIHLAPTVDMDTLIITQNEEITYTVTGGGETITTTEWHSTGISYNQPADCEDRVVVLENEVKELEDKDEELINRVTQLEENGGEITLYISPTGNDNNDGLTASNPKKTVKACVDAGATRISAMRGTYREQVSLSNIDTLEIFPTDNDYYSSDVDRFPPIIFDTSDTIAISDLSDYNGIKQVPYSKTNESFNYVFTQGNYGTYYGTSHGYYACVWLITDNRKNDIKLRPMSTIAEVESNVDTFTWVDNTIYLNADLTNVNDIRVNTILGNAFYIGFANKVKLIDIHFLYSGRYNLFIEKCANIEVDNCACIYASSGSGFDVKDGNGIFRNCYASKVHDGYGIGGCGHTIFIDCVAEWCYDDGMSHHIKCTGTVIGGRYEGNRKAGNAPAYGANVNIYGGLYKDNQMWGIAYVTDDTHEPSTGIVQNAVITGNDIGLVVNSTCEVTALDCVYKDNNTDKENKGSLLEYTNSQSSSLPSTTQSGGIEFVDSEDEFTDTSKVYVLPNGKVYAFMGTGTGTYTPNFTDLMDDPNAYIKSGERWSLSGGAWSNDSSIDSIVIPFSHNGTANSTSTIRIRGAKKDDIYKYVYFGVNSEKFTTSINESWSTDNEDIVLTLTNASQLNGYITFTLEPLSDADSVIITLNEEITYTYDENTESYAWIDTGYSLVVGDNTSSTPTVSFESSVFDTPAYAPIPQLPADGSEGTDLHGLNVTTQQAYDYMDILANKHKGYVTKQVMGKDQSGAYDHNRYILCKSYYRGWLKPNYPKMFAWKNGSTIVYSVSVSPRIGDTMYSTPYVGTAYNTVTSVNCSTPNPSQGIVGTPSTRTVNGLIFDRYKDGDVEPTIVYTKVETSISALNSGTVYDSKFSSLTKVTNYTKESITCADGITYTRYPFEDRKADKTKPLSVFILANEHGHHGDNKVPSIILMRMAKDLCENKENAFLKWVKENVMITMIPVGNPWGYDPSVGDTGVGYYNSRGVNINRNYDTDGWAGSDTNYGDVATFGEYAGSEIETQHIMNTMHLCKANVGLSMHGLGLGQYKTSPTEYTDGLMWQGCGFDRTRMTKVAEVLFTDYGQLISGHTSGDQGYQYCGKSPAYIQYVGAVGGLNEIPDYETGTLDLYTPKVMESGYTQMLLFLQTWIKEYLDKQ